MIIYLSTVMLSYSADIDYAITNFSEIIQIRITHNVTVNTTQIFHLDQPSKHGCVHNFRDKSRLEILSILDNTPSTTPSNDAVLHNLLGIFLFEDFNDHFSYEHFLYACKLSNYSTPEYVLNAALVANSTNTTSVYFLLKNGILYSSVPYR